MKSHIVIAVALICCTLCEAGESTPRLSADGYCHVSLVDNQVWIKGEPSITTDYRGCRFHFLNGDAKDKFDKRPEFYAPMLDGNDPVLAADEDKVVAGKRDFPMRHHDRTFFFGSEKTMMVFDANPDFYFTRATHRQSIEDKLRNLESERGKPTSTPQQ